MRMKVFHLCHCWSEVYLCAFQLDRCMHIHARTHTLTPIVLLLRAGVEMFLLGATQHLVFISYRRELLF